MSRISHDTYIPAENEILLRGWLDEATKNSRGKDTTVKRWVVLQKKAINVYSDVVTSEERRLASYSLTNITDVSFENESSLHWFSFCGPSGPVKFFAPSEAEREKWLNAFRTWVPLMKMEATREMLQRKAEGQAVRELLILQQQLAIQQICNAEHRVIVLTTFREYCQLLVKNLREVLHSIAVIMEDRMTAAQYVSATIENLVDSANSAVAASSDITIKTEIAARVKSIIGLAASFLQECRSAAHNDVSANNFSEDAESLKEGLHSFIQYLHQLGLCSELD